MEGKTAIFPQLCSSKALLLLHTPTPKNVLNETIPTIYMNSTKHSIYETFFRFLSLIITLFFFCVVYKRILFYSGVFHTV